MQRAYTSQGPALVSLKCEVCRPVAALSGSEFPLLNVLATSHPQGTARVDPAGDWNRASPSASWPLHVVEPVRVNQRPAKASLGRDGESSKWGEGRRLNTELGETAVFSAVSGCRRFLRLRCAPAFVSPASPVRNVIAAPSCFRGPEPASSSDNPSTLYSD